MIRRYGRRILENADESESNLPSEARSAENGHHRRANKARQVYKGGSALFELGCRWILFVMLPSIEFI